MLKELCSLITNISPKKSIPFSSQTSLRNLLVRVRPNVSTDWAIKSLSPRSKTLLALLSFSLVPLSHAGPTSGLPKIPEASLEACKFRGGGACEALIRRANRVLDRWEESCISKTSMEDKALHYLGVVKTEAEVQSALQIASQLGSSKQEIVGKFYTRSDKKSFCGGLFDPKVTYIELCAVDENGSIACWPTMGTSGGETGPVTNHDSLKMNLDNRRFVELLPKFRCSNGTCTGDIVWFSGNTDVVKTDQLGYLTAESNGSTDITAFSRAFMNLAPPSMIQGEVPVVVGGGVDIVLAVETTNPTYFWIGFYDRWPGLRNLGDEIVAELKNRFGTSYRFGLIGYSHYPVQPWGSSRGACVELFGYDKFKPYAETAAYRDWLALSPDDEAIKNGISNVRLMCLSTYPQVNSVSSYSAAIHAINDYDWGDGTYRAIVLFALADACTETGWLTTSPPPPSCEAEGVTGYTKEDVINLANEKGVSIFTVSAGRDTGWDSLLLPRIRSRLMAIAEGTGGEFQESPRDMMELLETAFGQIYEKMKSSSR